MNIEGRKDVALTVRGRRLLLIITPLLVAAILLIPMIWEVPRALAQPSCNKLESISIGPETIAFQLLRPYGPFVSSPDVKPTNPRVFLDECHIINISTNPKKVILTGSPDGRVDVSVDDQLELTIKSGFEKPLSFLLAFTPGPDPKKVVPSKPLVLSEYFKSRGEYTVQVKATDVYGYYHSVEPGVYLVFELEPLKAQSGADPIRVLVVVSGVIGSITAVILLIWRIWSAVKGMQGDDGTPGNGDWG